MRKNVSILTNEPKQVLVENKKKSLLPTLFKKRILNTLVATSIAMSGTGCASNSTEKDSEKEGTPATVEKSEKEQEIEKKGREEANEAAERGYEYLSEHSIYVRPLTGTHRTVPRIYLTDSTGKSIVYTNNKYGLDPISISSAINYPPIDDERSREERRKDLLQQSGYSEVVEKNIFQEFKTGKFGVLNKEAGNKIEIPFEYEFIRPTRDPNKFIVGKYGSDSLLEGLINIHNEVIIPFQNSTISLDENAPSYILQILRDKNTPPALFDYNGKNIAQTDKKTYSRILKDHFEENPYHKDYNPYGFPQELSTKESQLFKDIIEKNKTHDPSDIFPPVQLSTKYIFIGNTIYDKHRNIIYTLPDNSYFKHLSYQSETKRVPLPVDKYIYILVADSGAEGAFDADSGILIKPDPKNTSKVIETKKVDGGI